jgi:hypothetical protein
MHIRASMRPLSIGLFALAACSRDATPPPVVQPRQPLRDAIGDRDLRTMIAEVASTKACALLEHQFRPLRDKDHPEIANGVLWIRGCKITHRGTAVDVELGASGWTWAEQAKDKLGAKFAVHQYVRFNADILMKGTIDVAYDRETHIASVWFSPSSAPDVKFKTVAGVDVDREGVWSSIIGAVATTIGENPDREGTQEATKVGTHEMTGQLADGLSMTMDLCTGLPRMSLGRPPKGQMGPADAGETRQVPIEIHEGGVMVFPPQLAPHGMSVKVDTKGPVHIGLACEGQAEAAAEQFLAGKPATAKYLAQSLVTGTETLRVGAQSCAVTVIATSASPLDVSFDYARPATETARATGGPMIACERKK